MSRQRSAMVVVAVAGILLISGCGTSGATSSLAASSSDVRPSLGAPDLGACEMGPHVCDGPMPPGTYASDTLDAYIEFQVGEGWSGGIDFPDEGFYLQDVTKRAPAALTVTRFPDEVFADPCAVGDTVPVDGGASAVAAWIVEQSWADAAVVTETELAGRPTVEVSFTVASDCPDPVVYLWPLPTSVEFHLNEGELARILFVDTSAGTLAFVSEVYPDADVPGFGARVDDVLGSVTITD